MGSRNDGSEGGEIFSVMHQAKLGIWGQDTEEIPRAIKESI